MAKSRVIVKRDSAYCRHYSVIRVASDGSRKCIGTIGKAIHCWYFVDYEQNTHHNYGTFKQAKEVAYLKNISL